jgi:DNA-binding NarL/FixJ family response regulator
MRVLASGASCLARSTSTADLLVAIHLTAEGTRVFVSSDGRRIERPYPSAALFLKLTVRETEVAEHLSEGRSNPEIAHLLQISVETARTHVATVLRKLEVRSRRQLIAVPIPSRPRNVG